MDTHLPAWYGGGNNTLDLAEADKKVAELEAEVGGINGDTGVRETIKSRIITLLNTMIGVTTAGALCTTIDATVDRLRSGTACAGADLTDSVRGKAELNPLMARTRPRLPASH